MMAPDHLKYMNSVLFAFTWWTIVPAAYSRLCSRDLTWAGEVLDHLHSLCLIVSAGYHRCLAFFLCKAIFLLDLLVFEVYNLDRYGTIVSPCKTPVTMLKLLLSGG